MSETDEEFVADMEWLHSHDREAALPPEKLSRLFVLARRGAGLALDRQYDVYAAAREEYRKKIAEQAARIERLESLLRPFAKAANGFDSYSIKNPEEWFCYGGVQGSGETTGAITVGDLRRARAALEGK